MERFKKGTLKYIILMLLNTGPKGVYDIKKYIKEISFGFYNPSTGVLYPNLKNMLNENLIKETNVKGKRKFVLTDEGKKIVDENIKKWKSIFERRSKKFEKMDQIRDIIQKIMKNIILMDDERFEKNFEKIIEIINDANKKIENL
ncbi:MAG: PadR family transcriptional regulator [Thermoplasmata archaeon]|nr:PadR family transcriptional regulator [Thermoplasmata archaeon]